jgi:hypothetical protein
MSDLRFRSRRKRKKTDPKVPNQLALGVLHCRQAGNTDGTARWFFLHTQKAQLGNIFSGPFNGKFKYTYFIEIRNILSHLVYFVAMRYVILSSFGIFSAAWVPRKIWQPLELEGRIFQLICKYKPCGGSNINLDLK